MGKCKHCGGDYDDLIMKRHIKENPEYGLLCDYCNSPIYIPSLSEQEVNRMFPGTTVRREKDLPEILRKSLFKKEK